MPLLSQDIFAAAKNNAFFRKEILTNEHSQLVLMSVEPGEEIGEEVHEGVDQVFLDKRLHVGREHRLVPSSNGQHQDRLGTFGGLAMLLHQRFRKLENDR